MSAKKKKTKNSAKENPLKPPAGSIWLYDVLWQMEMWLREMVYMELRARDPAWESTIQRHIQGWPPRSQTSDKRYRHMSTRHQSAISYLTTGELFEIIRHQSNWLLFESYFQPKNILEAKFEEIKQIRNRIAHFRAPHEDDLNRVRLFLKEIDSGIWRFCSTASCSGLGELPPPDVADPVSDHFVDTHDQRTVVEMHDARKGWFYAKNSMHPRIGFHVGFSVRPWANIEAPSLAGKPGIVYHASFRSLHMSSGMSFDHEQILKDTEAHHHNCIHIRLQGGRGLEITIPSVLGEAIINETVERFLRACINNSHSSRQQDDASLCALADNWPEYVLPPSHPIGLLSDDTPCPMFYLE